MSLGYTGLCKKIKEDEKVVVYTYSGENWNDGGKSKDGDNLLQDGLIIIYKKCLVEPEIHSKIKKMPSGKKKRIEKRIHVIPSLGEYINEGNITIKECKNAFYKNGMNVDYLALRLLYRIFYYYQENDVLPEEECFIQ